MSTELDQHDPDAIRATVRDAYAAAAVRATAGQNACCGPDISTTIVAPRTARLREVFGPDLYRQADRDQLPAEAVAASADWEDADAGVEGGVVVAGSPPGRRQKARAYWLGANVDPDLSLVTVGQWLDIWVETRQALRPATRKIYTQLICDYLQPHLGGVALRELTVGKTQAMFTALLRANATRAHPLAPATFPAREMRHRHVVRRIRRRMNSMMHLHGAGCGCRWCGRGRDRDGSSVQRKPVLTGHGAIPSLARFEQPRDMRTP